MRRKSGDRTRIPSPEADEIEQTLEEQLPFLGVSRPEAKERQAVELGDRRPGQLRVEEVDGHGHHDTLGLAVVDRSLQGIEP